MMRCSETEVSIMEKSKLPFRRRKVWPGEDDFFQTKVRQWKLFETNIRFLCNGRITFGPGIWIWWVLIFLHMSCTIFIFLWFEVLPYEMSYNDLPIKAVLIVIGIFGLWNLLMIVFTDPGILPKETDPARVNSLITTYLKSEEPKDKQCHIRRTPSSLCVKCYVYRPRSIRAYHCETCDACIERYDHHCMIFGTCIGVRNYRYFVRFLLATVSSLLGIAAFSVNNLVKKWIEKGFCIAASESPTSFLILAALIIPPAGLLHIGYLACIHLKLTCTNKTLKETKEENSYSNAASVENARHECCCTFLFSGVSNFWSNVCTNPPPKNFHPRKFTNIDTYYVPPKQLGLGLKTDGYTCDINFEQLSKKKKRVRKVLNFRTMLDGALKIRTRSLVLKRLQSKVLMVKPLQNTRLRISRNVNTKKGFYEPYYTKM